MVEFGDKDMFYSPSEDVFMRSEWGRELIYPFSGSLGELCFTEEHVTIYESFITRFVRQHLSVAKTTNPFKFYRLKACLLTLVSDLCVCCLLEAVNQGLSLAEMRCGFPSGTGEKGLRSPAILLKFPI